MKVRLALGLVVAGLSVGLAFPQERARRSPAVLERAPEGTVLFDNDGGRVQVVPALAVPRGRVSYHGGPVVSAPQLEVVFLGSEWGAEEMIVLKDRALQHLTSFGQSEEYASLARYGVRAGAFSLSRTEDLGDPAKGKTIRDLEIQARLNALANPVGEDRIYLVFLSQGISSQLGRGVAGKDYMAYHNNFNGDTGPVRYAVVPFRAETDHWLSHATDVVVQTVINPEGNAWY